MAEPEGAGTYPTQTDLLTANPLLDWIDENFLRSDPFAFRDVGFRPVVALIRRELNVEPNGIYCVGSGAVGYSLSPNKMRPTGLKPFDESSDLDLAIIEIYFELAWREIRTGRPADSTRHLIRAHGKPGLAFTRIVGADQARPPRRHRMEPRGCCGTVSRNWR